MNRTKETAAVAFSLLALLLIAISYWHILVTRPLWLDEVHTLIVASRPGAGRVIADVTAGIDTAPGLLHLLYWVIGRATRLTPVVLHVVPFVAVWIGHVFVFATLRRWLALVPSIAGTLAVLLHLLVIQMTFEARFYGPWLMLAAAFAWVVGLPPGWRRDAGVALLAVLICTIHWFGVISLAILCVAVVAAHWRQWRTGVRVVAPAAAGIVALLLCLPVLRGQRAAVTAPTWIPAVNFDQVWVMARTFYVALVPLLAVLIILASRLRSEPPARDDAALVPSGGPLETPLGARTRSGITALALLALMPVAMLVVSYVLQPTLLDRYATVAALAWAPLVGYAVQQLPSRGRVLFTALLLCVGFVNYRRAAGGMLGFRRVLDADVRSFDAAVERTRLPIVFQARHVQYPIVAEQPRGRDRVFFLSLPDSTLDAMFAPGGPLRLMAAFFRFEREAALLHERVYGFPPVRTQAQLDTTASFLLLGSDASLPAGYKNVERFALAVFPRHTVTRLEGNLALLTRK
jgi:hypothetical protein